MTTTKTRTRTEDDNGEEKAEEDRSGDGGHVGSEAEVEPQG